MTVRTAAHRLQISDSSPKAKGLGATPRSPLLTPPPAARPPGSGQQPILERLLAASRRLPCPLRNEALVHLLVGTGLNPIEIALLRVRHYVAEDGSVRRRSQIDRAIAYNGRERPLLFVSHRVCDALDAYLHSRRLHGESGPCPVRYRGLNPDAALILGNDGNPLRVVERMGGRQPQRLCAAMHILCRAIFNEAQISDMTARDTKKLFARTLYRMGADVEGIRILLGLARRRSVLRILGSPRTTESEADRVAGLVSQVL